jgi:hypothetical protein
MSTIHDEIRGLYVGVTEDPCLANDGSRLSYNIGGITLEFVALDGRWVRAVDVPVDAEPVEIVEPKQETWRDRMIREPLL